MTIVPLSKAKQKVLEQLSSRHGRRKSSFFICEGLTCCAEALSHQSDWIDWVLIDESQLDERIEGLLQEGAFPIYQCRSSQFKQLAQTEHPQGLLLVMRRPVQVAPDAPQGETILVLDQLSDPGNVGTILRTAWATGVREVVVTQGTTDPFAPKAIRAGMGAQFVLNIWQAESFEAAGSHYSTFGYNETWVASPRDGIDYRLLEFNLKNAVLVVGNEAHGSSTEGFKTVTIPMPGQSESLNVAQAATLLLFERLRR